MLVFVKGNKVVLTKCGGMNPKIWSQYFKDLDLAFTYPRNMPIFGFKKVRIDYSKLDGLKEDDIFENMETLSKLLKSKYKITIPKKIKIFDITPIIHPVEENDVKAMCKYLEIPCPEEVFGLN